MNDPRKKIYLAILNQGSIRIELVQLLLELERANEYQIIMDLPCEKPIAHNRGMIVKKFLEGDSDFLIMLDGDIIPPLDFLNLTKYDADIIGGTCFGFKGDGIVPLVVQKLPKKYIKNKTKEYKVLETKDPHGIKECDAIGTGCIVISRRVLEALKDDAPFVNEYDKQGLRMVGLDFNFCRKAQKKGFKVYAHLDYVCSHWTEMDLRQIYLSMVNEGLEYKKMPSRKV